MRLAEHLAAQFALAAVGANAQLYPGLAETTVNVCLTPGCLHFTEHPPLRSVARRLISVRLWSAHPGDQQIRGDDDEQLQALAVGQLRELRLHPGRPAGAGVERCGRSLGLLDEQMVPMNNGIDNNCCGTVALG